MGCASWAIRRVEKRKSRRLGYRQMAKTSGPMRGAVVTHIGQLFSEMDV
jgi:hypothetical protein